MTARLVKGRGGKLFVAGTDVANFPVQRADVLSTKIESECFVLVPHFGIRIDQVVPEDEVALAELVAPGRSYFFFRRPRSFLAAAGTRPVWCTTGC